MTPSRAKECGQGNATRPSNERPLSLLVDCEISDLCVLWVKLQ